jgi:hypothetical protein
VDRILPDYIQPFAEVHIPEKDETGIGAYQWVQGIAGSFQPDKEIV